MAIDVNAELRYCQISPQKMRLVIDMVRGKNAEESISRLRFVNKKAAKPVIKLISSALANAENNFGLPREDMIIHTIIANPAPLRKWRRFGARGRIKPILRRSSHVHVMLREKNQ